MGAGDGWHLWFGLDMAFSFMARHRSGPRRVTTSPGSVLPLMGWILPHTAYLQPRE